MSSRRDRFLAAYDARDHPGLEEFLKDACFELTAFGTLTSEATRWLLDHWADQDDATAAPPAPPPETVRRYIGGVDV